MFKVAKFDENRDGDTACKQLFANAPSFSKKKVKKGRVEKKDIRKKNSGLKSEDKIKDEIRAILQQKVDLIQKNVNSKEKTSKQRPQETQNKTMPQKTQAEYVDSIKTRKKNKKKKKNFQSEQDDSEKDTIQQKKKQKIELSDTSAQKSDYKQKKREKLKEKLEKTLNPLPEKKEKSKNLTLRQRMMARLQAARFRFINEQIYSVDSKEAQKIFLEDPDAFDAYHEGYRQQVSKWPLNPLDVIIKSIQRLPRTYTVADFGCGDAKLAKSVAHKVHSFDLVAANDSVTACDMAHVPLQNSSVDVVVFCLSLMGTNLHDYLLEANRVLKPEGILKIAEVESRFDDVNQFIEALKRFNFKNTWRDESHNLFYFLDFKKEANVKNRKKLPRLSLHPCLYKKR